MLSNSEYPDPGKTEACCAQLSELSGAGTIHWDKFLISAEPVGHEVATGSARIRIPATMKLWCQTTFLQAHIRLEYLWQKGTCPEATH